MCEYYQKRNRGGWEAAAVPRALLGHSQLPLPPEESQTILAKCLEGWHGTDVAVKV